MKTCCCERPPFNFNDYEITVLGVDSDYAEVSISACKKCGTKWLKYLIEDESVSRSGRWWRVKLDIQDIDKQAAKRYIENQKSCFRGGSYFGHTGKLYDFGPIKIR